MAAPSGGGRPGGGARAPMSPVFERPEGGQGGARPEPARAEPRSLAEIFPQNGNADRGRELHGTWRDFCQDMDGAVQAALERGRSPPEIAYAIGELVARRGPTRKDEALVSFGGAPAKAPWTGDETPPAARPLAEAALAAPPSPLVSVRSRDAADFDRLLARVLERVPARLNSWQRDAVVQAIGD